jgi:lactate dehydrogenase-like 2-hydroxyacid dehydrogenase
MTEVVLVTDDVFQRAEAVFRATAEWRVEPAPAQEEPLAEMAQSRTARAAIVGTQPYAGPLYDSLAAAGAGRGGAIIARFGVGHDNIDKRLAGRRGIVVTNTPGDLEISVAEHALWLMGNLARRVNRLDSQLRAGRFTGDTGMELHGKTLAVVGFGAIGRRVAAMARFGLGMEVLAVGSRSPEEMQRQAGCPLADLLAKHGASLYTDDLHGALAQADAVALHLPSNPRTKHIIDAACLNRMKPTALLINTARGAVVDEAALFDALSSGRIGGAALDVFESEPYRPVAPEKDLRTLENALLTPHVGSNTLEANARMARACLENVGCFFRGRMDKLARVD